jgi:septum formation protein
MSPDTNASSVRLASRSPRRRELLERIGVVVEIAPADIDESPAVGEQPTRYVERLARSKLAAVIARTSGRPSMVTLAADTTVDADGRILGQPADEADAREMLAALSGRNHRVHTAVAVADRHGTVRVDVVTSLVTMVPITDTLAEWYLGTGEPFGKAGGYAVQGAGGVLVESVRGSLSNVVGLPLRETARLLEAAGVCLPGRIRPGR